MSTRLKAELSVTCSTLGRLHKGEYLIEPECIESVKDLIRYLKRDNDTHEIRRFLGDSKVLQNDLIHIVKSCPDDNADLFDVTLRLLINLTTPALLFYGEEIPEDKIARNIYLTLVGYSQDYKIAFCDVEFWNKICGKLTDLFETEWAERSMDDGIQIERILMLMRNVLQVPADVESEKRPDNDITVHDKVLWALRQSQILELLLFISSNRNEEQYYLNLLEIFSLILREHNPKMLAQCHIQSSAEEKAKDTEELIKVRETEKVTRNKYVNMRNFNATFVMKGVKSLSNHDVVCHKTLDKVDELNLNRSTSKKIKTRKNKVPVESERVERRSTYSVRLFLKEFCLEFLNGSFGHFMDVVKNKLDCGKSLANDQTYYFWALKFFLDFATTSNVDLDMVEDLLSFETFHFIQTSMDNAFDHIRSEKKKPVYWIKRIHTILKAYRSLLETLVWMDCSKNPLTRSISRELKSQIFYVVEYREMTLHMLLQYDSTKFSVSYLRDLVETTHIFIKLLEEYSKQTKLVVQEIKRKKSSKKSKKVEEKIETAEEKWERIKDDVYDILCCESCFPEIPPFDAALDVPIDDQKGRAMKKIQKLLQEGNIKDGIGLLRSARQVWPENDNFGADGMSVEDETMALQEICLADLGEVEIEEKEVPVAEELNEEDSENEDVDNESKVRVVEQDFQIMEYKMRLVNKKVVEGCGILLRNYKKNPDHTNHCVIKLLHRIGWECGMPAMLYQASLFWTLLKIMRDKTKEYKEINTFTVNLIRKFRKHAEKNPVVFLDLLFWKDSKIAMEIQQGYELYPALPEEEKTEKKRRRRKKNKSLPEGDDLEMNEETRSKNGTEAEQFENFSENEDGGGCLETSVNLSKIDSQPEGDENIHTKKKRERKKKDKVLPEEELKKKRSRKKKTKMIEPFEKFIENDDGDGNLEPHNDSESEEGVTSQKSAPVEDKSQSNSLLDPDEEEAESNQPVRKHKNRIRAIIDSSDEEEEEKSQQNNSKPPNYSSDEEVIEPNKTIPEEKDSDNSQTSNASSKKRSREDKGDSIYDDDDVTKSKRIRYIGSDSDMENFGSGNEETISVNQEEEKRGERRIRRKRLAMIDSDSDVETNSFDEK